MVDLVRADLKRPVRKGHVNPACRRAKRTPVRADGRAGRRGEVELLVRADTIHDETAPEIVAVQRPRGVRRGNGRETGPLVRDRRRIADETTLRRLNPALETLLLAVRDRSWGIKRMESTSGADHHLDIVRATAVAAAVARLGAGDHPHCDEEGAEDDASGLRLLLEEHCEVAQRMNILLAADENQPRAEEHPREKQQSPCPYLHQDDFTSTLWRNQDWPPCRRASPTAAPCRDGSRASDSTPAARSTLGVSRTESRRTQRRLRQQQ